MVTVRPPAGQPVWRPCPAPCRMALAAGFTSEGQRGPQELSTTGVPDRPPAASTASSRPPTGEAGCWSSLPPPDHVDLVRTHRRLLIEGGTLPPQYREGRRIGPYVTQGLHLFLFLSANLQRLDDAPGTARRSSAHASIPQYGIRHISRRVLRELSTFVRSTPPQLSAVLHTLKEV